MSIFKEFKMTYQFSLVTQDKTNLPLLKMRAKDDEGKTRWKHHLYGMLAHGQPNHVRFWLHDQRTPQDSNLTIHCILKTLHKIGWDNLPPKLAVQLDNTARENKNHYVFAFLAMFKATGVFSHVRLARFS